MNNRIPRPPAERFATLVESVAKALAAEGLRLGLVAPWLALIWGKLRSTGARIQRIAAALEAGTLRLQPPRPLPPLAPRPEGSPPQPDQPVRPKIPQGFGWLLRRVTALSFGRSQLEYLLNEGDMAALIQAAPPVAHHLRPICRMLGVKPPPGLFPPRRPPRRQPQPPGPPQPGAPAAAEKAAETKRKPDGPFPAFVPRKRKRRRPFRLFPLPAATGPPWRG